MNTAYRQWLKDRAEGKVPPAKPMLKSTKKYEAKANHFRTIETIEETRPRAKRSVARKMKREAAAREAALLARARAYLAKN